MIEGQEGVTWEDWVALAEACEANGVEALFRSDHYVSGFDERIGVPLRNLMARGQGSGDIRKDVPAAWLTEALFGLVVSVMASAPALGTDDTIAAISNVFLDGARGERGS